ncbi:MAG: tyrosine-type recombinase/integrase [Planctomycetes bacterium]|nr:tyrosine-type recombinase/integrase [Planctomycetota bacterium]
MRLDECLDQHLQQMRANGRATSTLGQIQRHITMLMNHLGHDIPIEAVTRESLAGFLTLDSTRTRSDGSYKNETSLNALRSSIRNFFRFCCDAGYLTIDPSRLIRDAICEPPPPRALTDDECERLLAALDADNDNESTRDRILFTLLLQTGIRLGSALAVDVADIDFDNAIIELRCTKRNRPDRVEIPRELWSALRAFVAFRKDGRLFAITSRHAQRRFQHYCSRAGISRHASPHALRHTFAQNLYAQRHDIFEVKRALRHRSFSSTEVYMRCAEL